MSEGFFEQLQKHPIPIEEAAVKQIANNSMALDVYVWLSYRLHSLKEARPISWKALHAQFGRGICRMDHFKQQFRETLELALQSIPRPTSHRWRLRDHSTAIEAPGDEPHRAVAGRDPPFAPRIPGKVQFRVPVKSRHPV